MKNSLLVLFFALLLSGPGRGELPDSLRQEFQHLIRKEMKRNGITGISVALVDDQEVVWAEGFGYANRQKNQKASPSTIYRVGSISKLFTGLGILQMADQSRLQLDQRVSDHVSGFGIRTHHPISEPITIRSLMTHQSGLPSDLLGCLFMQNPPPFTEVVGYLNEEYAISAPWTCQAYSNAAITLLGVVLERASGQDFLTYTRDNILTPLGMGHSSFDLAIEQDSNYAAAYTGRKKAFIEPPLFEVPAGMLHSSAEDLANFMRMIFARGVFNGYPLISGAWLDSAFCIQNRGVQRDRSNTIGLSWFIHGPGSKWEYASGMAEHGGDTHAYHSQLSVLPEHKLGFVILTNSRAGAGPIRDISDKVIEAYLAKVKGLHKPEEKKTPLQLLKTPSSDLSDHTGLYALGPNPVTISLRGGNLSFKQSGLTMILRPNSRETFTLALRVLGLFSIPFKTQEVFFQKVDSTDHLFAIAKGDTFLVGARIPAPVYSENWKQRVGKYAPSDGGQNFQLVRTARMVDEDGWLRLRLAGDMGSLGSVGLYPLNDHEAIVPGYGRNTGYTVRFEGDTLTVARLVLVKKK